MKQPQKLNALRAFEATARLGSYRAAAREIGVTPEAVGQLVRSLEAWLGAELFRRETGGKRLRLTVASAQALPSLSQAFALIGDVIETLEARPQLRQVVVSAAPSIAAKWLVPRLAGFLTQHPSIDVRLDITERLVDLDKGDADIAIRFGPIGDDQGMLLLPEEQLLAVANPDLIARINACEQGAGLTNQTLIRDATVRDPAYPSWRDWFSLHEMEGVDRSRVLEFNASVAAIEACLRGDGVGLLRKTLITEDLASGKLVPIAGTGPVATGWAYRAILAARANSHARTFHQWLLDAAAEFSGASSAEG